MKINTRLQRSQFQAFLQVSLVWGLRASAQ